MKKLLWLIVLFAWPVAGSAEEMSFVTTLSAPVGVFSHVETPNPKTVATEPTVNFCQTRSNAGTITLQGTDANKVAFSTPSLQLQNGTTLGRMRSSNVLRCSAFNCSGLSCVMLRTKLFKEDSVYSSTKLWGNSKLLALTR